MNSESHESSLPASVSPVGYKYAFGVLGLLVAIIGLGFSVAAEHRRMADQVYVEKAAEVPEAEWKLSDTLAEAGDKFVGKMIDRFKPKRMEPEPVTQGPAAPPQRPEKPSEQPLVWYLSLFGTSIGFVGACSGSIGWIRREDHRLATAAMITGFLAIAWLYLVMAFAAAAFLAFLTVFLSGFSS